MLIALSHDLICALRQTSKVGTKRRHARDEGGDDADVSDDARQTYYVQCGGDVNCAAGAIAVTMPPVDCASGMRFFVRFER